VRSKNLKRSILKILGDGKSYGYDVHKKLMGEECHRPACPKRGDQPRPHPQNELRILLLDGNHRTRALTALPATSGLRIGEAAGLRVGNLNLDQEKVTVMALRSKSRSTRIAFISPENAQILRDYIRLEHLTPEDWLFPNQYDRKKTSRARRPLQPHTPQTNQDGATKETGPSKPHVRPTPTRIPQILLHKTHRRRSRQRRPRIPDGTQIRPRQLLPTHDRRPPPTRIPQGQRRLHLPNRHLSPT